MRAVGKGYGASAPSLVVGGQTSARHNPDKQGTKSPRGGVHSVRAGSPGPPRMAEASAPPAHTSTSDQA